MSYKVIIKEKALAEVSAAYNYYEDKQSGLGDRFLESLYTVYENLAHTPGHYSFVAADKEKSFRDVKLNKFPFVVVFEIIKNEVVVYAVHHTSKKTP